MIFLFRLPIASNQIGIIALSTATPSCLSVWISPFGFATPSTCRTFYMRGPHIGDDRTSACAYRLVYSISPGWFAPISMTAYRVVVQAQQGQGYTDVIIQIALGKQGISIDTQYGRHHFLDGGLAITAGNAHYRHRRLVPPGSCQFGRPCGYRQPRHAVSSL